MLDYKQIKEEYPKFTEGYHNWLRDLIKNVTGSEAEEENVENLATVMVDYNFRLLYDFFDSVGIYITITREEDKWVYYNQKSDKNTAESRTEADKLALLDAIKLYNV